MDSDPFEGKLYDVFLSHSSRDKSAVDHLARKLEAEGLRTFLDRWHLIPGEPWQEGIERALKQSRTCAVFLGSQGEAPWRNEEMRTALNDRARYRLERVIPVRLPEALLPESGDLPSFLSRLKWVEFHQGLGDKRAFHELVCGIEGRAPGPTETPVSKRTDACPFRGLEPFYAAHAEFFFGREAFVQQLLETLRRSRFLAVVGPPGSGKSSAVRAGLVPALKQEALPGSANWRILDITPGFHPLDQLVDQLMQGIAPRSSPIERRQLRSALCQDPRALHLELQRRLKKQTQPSIVCFLIDQLEELFILTESESERQAFLDNLLYASGISWGHAVVIMTLRADFQVHSRRYGELADRMMTHRVIIPPMTEMELRQAIERPTQLVGFLLDPGLVEVVLRDLQGQSATLPLLQHILLELWKRREDGRLTTKAYAAIDQIGGIFASWAGTIYNDLSTAQQATARRIFLRLIQSFGDNSDLQSRVRLSEFLSDITGSLEIEYIVDRFATVHLLTTIHDESNEKDMLIGLAHEEVRDYLRSWIEGFVPSWQTWLRKNAEHWQSHGRDSKNLLRGAELTEIKHWSLDQTREMDDLEQEFIAESLANCSPKRTQLQRVRFARATRRHKKEKE